MLPVNSGYFLKLPRGESKEKKTLWTNELYLLIQLAYPQSESLVLRQGWKFLTPFCLPSCLGGFRVRKVYIFMTKSFCTLFHQFWTWVAHPNPQSWASWNHICQPQLSLGLLKQELWDWVLGNWRFLKLPKWVDSKVGLRIVEPWRSPGTCDICWHFSQWYPSLCRARLDSGPNQTNW